MASDKEFASDSYKLTDVEIAIDSLSLAERLVDNDVEFWSSSSSSVLTLVEPLAATSWSSTSVFPIFSPIPASFAVPISVSLLSYKAASRSFSVTSAALITSALLVLSLTVSTVLSLSSALSLSDTEPSLLAVASSIVDSDTAANTISAPWIELTPPKAIPAAVIPFKILSTFFLFIVSLLLICPCLMNIFLHITQNNI